MPEQIEQREDEKHVPFQRNSHREVGKDVEVEDHHEPDEHPPPGLVAGDQDQNRGNQEFRRGTADMGHQLGHHRRAQVVDMVAVEHVLDRVEYPGPQQRVVARHHRDDVGEMVVELGRRRPPPQEQHDDFERGDLIGEREEEDQQFQPIVLTACGQEDGFVAQAQQRQGDDRRRHQDGVDQTDVASRGDRPAMPRRQQGPHRAAQHDGIQGDVDGAAGIAAGERHLVRPRR